MVFAPLNLDSELIQQIRIYLSNEGPLLFDDTNSFPDNRVVILRSIVNTALIKIDPLYQPALGQIGIYEWTEYLLEGKTLQNVSLPGAVTTRLNDHLYRFQLNNRIGRLRLNVSLTDQSHYTIFLAVLSHKYPKPKEHLGFFDTLLNDLIRRSTVLPFDIVQPTEFAADESSEPPTPLFVYHFLRQYAPQLESALETILANPHRTLLYHDDLIPLAQATHADASVLDAILTQPELLIRTQQNLPITRALRGHAPSHLWQPLAEETFDTPPNRFAKQFLAELADWSVRLSEAHWLTPYLSSLEAVRDKLAFAQYDPLWAEVGPLTRFPAENQVLLKRYGYREWADLWRRFHLARLPMWQQLQEAIDARDIATLYEMWCFFALVDRIGNTLEVIPLWQLELSDEKGLGYRSRVVFGDSGYTLKYNEGFGRGKNRSYSVTLRPDFTLHGPNGLCLVFDAKFRFDTNVFLAADDDADNLDNSPNTQRIAKQADLYKMHTYRDALGAQAVVILYPGDRNIFYHTDATDTDVEWTALINGRWAGVGAVAIKPNSNK